MTSEKETFEGDELVTETYRELGVEKAPEHLNQSILRMAAAGGKPSPARGVLFGPFMKPLAWAATIGLSLAIVLELSQVPTAAIRPDIAPTAEMMRKEAAVDEVVVQDNDVLEKTENRARLQSGPSRQLDSEDDLGRSADTHDQVEVFSREAKGKLDAVAAPMQSSQPESPQTEEISAARERAAGFSAAKKQAADIPADSLPKGSDSLLMEQTDGADSCDVAARLSEEGWQTCIENLRQSGNEEAADREYEAFMLEYPVESRDLEGNK